MKEPLEVEDVCIKVDAGIAHGKHGSASSKGMPVILQGVGYTVPSNNKRGKEVSLLQGVSGHFSPGQMTALLGPSGSGKTTLLNLLAGRTTSGSMAGSISVGGVTPSPAFLRRYTGYVEQFDTLIGTLTVQEMLMYTAELKRPRSEALATKRGAVEALLQRLQLDACKDVKIGGSLAKGISGGQAKRTNIGIALITNPRVLFLDEPTSGLDSATANGVMAAVASLAADGVTLITTIHSPTAITFGLFNAVMVLMRGQVIYFGDAHSGLDSYLGEVFPADLLLSSQQGGAGGLAAALLGNKAELLAEAVTEADRQGRAGELAKLYASSAAAAAADTATDRMLLPSTSKELLSAQQAKELSTRSATVTPWWWGIKTLFKYRTLTNYKDPSYLLPRFMDKLFIGVLVLALYWQQGKGFTSANLNNQTAMLFMYVTLPAFSASAYMPSIVLERSLFVRERNDGLYRVITYLVAKMLDELLLAGGVTLVVACMVWFGVGLQGSFAAFWLTYYITLCIGIVLAYFIASIAPGMDAANAMLPAYVTTLLYFGGLLITFDSMPDWLRWYSNIVFIKFGWGALMVNQFEASNPPYLGDTTMLDFYGFEGVDKWQYIGYLCIFFAVFFTAAWATLSMRKFTK